MGKVIKCNKVNPSGDCTHVVRGATEQEVLKNAAAHAKDHGLEATPELMAQVKSFIAFRSTPCGAVFGLALRSTPRRPQRNRRDPPRRSGRHPA